mmetsp:Transcript_26364/g.55574  ORF Transcript_26364/g.55574 Transcript_26364/m.55574 type:complete len:666 (+) Transcript_26364:89-2086(+)
MIKLMTSIVSNKSLDADDITNIESARKEIARIRKLMDAHQRAQAFKLKPLKKQIRVALNEKENIKDYVKVDVPKDQFTRQLIHDAIKNNVLFELNSEDELNELIDVFEPCDFKTGEVVIQQGNQGETFYVVESGELSITVSMSKSEDGDSLQDRSVHEVKVGFYQEGAAFGELALIYGSPRAATITVTEDCKLWRIKRNMYRGVVGQHRQKLHQEKLEFLPKVNVGNKVFGDVFSKTELDTMAQLLKQEYFKSGDVILREGEAGDTFYMIQSGKVNIFKKELGPSPIATFGTQKFFGERALLSDDVRQATVVAGTAVTCYVMTRGDFSRMLGNLQDILAGKVVRKKKRRTTDMGAKVDYKLSDLITLNVLGEGAFGKVKLVKAKDTGKLYALKAQGKVFIEENGQKEYVVREYNLMQELWHPNILTLECAMQDSKYIYFLLNLLPGGELMDILQSKGKFTEDWTRFYSASVLLAYTEIHSTMIAYRDLKPENIVLDEHGYAVVVDFGLAKRCDGPTYTFCGTPDYLAPEIIRGTGYDWGVDYWGLGVLLYELTNGSPPFESYDPTGTAKKILRGRVNFPSSFSSNLQDLIRSLLTMDQSKRLGRLQGGTEEVMHHRFYHGFDWDGLLEKKVKVPYTPKLPKNMEKIGRPDKGRDRALESKWNPQL